MLKLLLQLFVALVSVHQICGTNPLSRRWKRQTCGNGQFQCSSGDCIDQFLLCDGEVNCKDGSDETERVCKNTNCPHFAFKCDYGACVDSNTKCNGVAECADKSDEKGCDAKVADTCKGNQFKCKSGICIDPFLICDGAEDCDDGSDEISEVCSGFTCPGFAFRCDYGACIDKDGRCNGIIQCADKSDEKPEMCGTTPAPPPPPPPPVPPVSEGCTLPPQPQNGNYKLAGCDYPCVPEPGTKVDRTFITYTCNSDFSLLGSQNILCQNGWSAPFPTCSRVSCEPLVNPSREIECKLSDKIVECGKPMAPGTVASLKCKEFYSHSHEFATYHTTCQSNGKWSKQLTSCIPKCGEQNPEGVPFIANGEKAKLGEFPWQVGIYRPIKGNMEQICGGSIISERMIVTAAHCFWDDVTSTRRDTSDHRVAVGKYFIDWKKNTSHVQYPEIEKIVLHNRFRGRNLLYAADIAIIILKNPIIMTIAVRPICFDDQQISQQLFTPGKKGIVVGWGITEEQQQSETLRYTILPFVDFDTCEAGVPDTFKQFLTVDKFCAGYKDGTSSVCPGDSGGGYGVKFRDGKWYLMGVVSVGVPSQNADLCNIQEYTTFTSIMFRTNYDFVRSQISLYS